MTHDLAVRADPRRHSRLPFETPPAAKLAAALASVVITLAITGAVVLGMTGDAGGPTLAQTAAPDTQA